MLKIYTMEECFMSDPRFAMAEVLRILKSAGIDDKEFWDEINNCTGPDHAIKICRSWALKAQEAAKI